MLKHIVRGVPAMVGGPSNLRDIASSQPCAPNSWIRFCAAMRLRRIRGYPEPEGEGLGLVGLGSYIVNTTGCNDCHTHPNWANGGNPYLGQPEQINTAEYLSGGRQFFSADDADRYFCEHYA